MTFKIAARFILLAATSTLSCQAWAQDAQATTSTPAPQSAPVGEIVVTAQHRSENVQKVPIAITVFNSAALQQRGLTNVSQIAGYTPNVEIKTSAAFAGSSQILAASIRDHAIVVDMSPSDGGSDDGPDPHDLYDSALGACKALTILWYAQRHAIPVEDIAVAIARDNRDERKGIYRLKAEVAISGPLSSDQRDVLLGVAAKCPVHKLMTNVTTEIETVWADQI